VSGGVYGFIGGMAILAPLDVEEERALYPIIEEGRRASELLATGSGTTDARRRRQLLRARQEGQEAESTLLRATFGLVRARVLERGYHFYNEVLEAAGVEGLVNALHRFDPQKGNRFSTYANYWIMKLVNQTVQQQAGLTDTEMRLILKYQRFERSQPERHLTKREVAQELDISQARAHEVMQLSRELQSRRFASVELDDVSDPRLSRKCDDSPARTLTRSGSSPLKRCPSRKSPRRTVLLAKVWRSASTKVDERCERALKRSVCNVGSTNSERRAEWYRN
jgi:DNA-directed RNA polymerase sigma subunit (sigma70/sigma32)